MRKVNVATRLFSMPLDSLASHQSKSLAARHFSKARDNTGALNFDILEMVGHRRDGGHISNFAVMPGRSPHS